MIEKLRSLREDTLVYSLSSVVGTADFRLVEFDLKKLETRFDQVKLLIALDVEGETLAALLEAFMMGIKHWHKIDKIAYVGDKTLWKPIIAMENLFTKFDEKYFDLDEMEKAWEWLGEEDDA